MAMNGNDHRAIWIRDSKQSPNGTNGTDVSIGGSESDGCGSSFEEVDIHSLHSLHSNNGLQISNELSDMDGTVTMANAANMANMANLHLRRRHTDHTDHADHSAHADVTGQTTHAAKRSGNSVDPNGNDGYYHHVPRCSSSNASHLTRLNHMNHLNHRRIRLGLLLGIAMATAAVLLGLWGVDFRWETSDGKHIENHKQYMQHPQHPQHTQYTTQKHERPPVNEHRNDNLFHELEHSTSIEQHEKVSSIHENSGYTNYIDKNYVRNSKYSPRMACFQERNALVSLSSSPSESSCHSITLNEPILQPWNIPNYPPSIPQLSDLERKSQRGGKPRKSSNDALYNPGAATDATNRDETEECKYADPSYQTLPSAPLTCNDVHAVGLDNYSFGSSRTSGSFGGNGENIETHIRSKLKYLTAGASKSVWRVTSSMEGGTAEYAILKTNRYSREFTPRYRDLNRRDALVSEKAGRTLQSFENFGNVSDFNSVRNISNVLPMYHYCGFSLLTPFATAGPLDDYVYDYPKTHQGQQGQHGPLMPAHEMLYLAWQAARGVFQSHLYRGGKATFVHADVKPAQFLLFHSPHSIRSPESEQTKEMTQMKEMLSSLSSMPTLSSMPIMQLNDFNRGRFLTRKHSNDNTNSTCPFRMCGVTHKGSTYRSPEEYMECADQTDAIDVYSLGGVFFFLLSDGLAPYFHVKSFERSVEKVLKGRLPRLPEVEDYEGWEEGKEGGDDVLEFVRERARHPAFLALKEVMLKCWTYSPEDRPSSLEVVQMLEEKLREVGLL